MEILKPSVSLKKEELEFLCALPHFQKDIKLTKSSKDWKKPDERQSRKYDSQSSVWLKFGTMFLLTVQNTLLGLSIRYSRTKDGPKFFKESAVVATELLKTLACLILITVKEGSLCGLLKQLGDNVFRKKLETLKVSVPSFIYVVQNNLLFVAATHLDIATYQITFQLKILATAIFAMAILKQRIRKLQWFSLVLLITGVAMVQLSNSRETGVKISDRMNQNRKNGFIAAFSACFLSGLAGVYFEKVLKGLIKLIVFSRFLKSVLAFQDRMFQS